MANLRDQLLKAGLIDKKAKHLAEQDDRKKAKAAKADAKVAAEQKAAEDEKARRYEEELKARRAADRKREAERHLHQQAQERIHRLESTIDRNQISIREGRRRFYFRAGGTKVGRLDLQERQAKALEDGYLCIVRDPADTAKPFKLMDDSGLAELLAIDPSALLFHAPSWRPIEEAQAALAAAAAQQQASEAATLENALKEPEPVAEAASQPDGSPTTETGTNLQVDPDSNPTESLDEETQVAVSTEVQPDGVAAVQESSPAQQDEDPEIQREPQASPPEAQPDAQVESDAQSQGQPAADQQ